MELDSFQRESLFISLIESFFTYMTICPTVSHLLGKEVLVAVDVAGLLAISPSWEF